jgi:dimethylhistidine N-methyltransferase
VINADAPAKLHPMIIDRETIRDTFRADVIDGLSQERKRIPAKHLYDARGSELFDAICEVDDYYPTRVERSIREKFADAIADAIGADATVIEPGAGAGEKAESLLATLDSPRAFVPIEISETALDAAARRVAERFPQTEVLPICADFTRERDFPDHVEGDRRVVFFPGSTIGNLERAARLRLMSAFASHAGDGGRLLIGYDLEKDEDVLRAAYNDREGVTAEFNRNLLRRINRELDGTFDLGAFVHDAPWMEERKRIEMHLVSVRDQTVQVCGRSFAFREGERIHTENSHKFTPDEFDAEASNAGFAPVERWTDERDWFCVGLYEARGK